MRRNTDPEVSVVMPVHRAGRHLAPAVEGILRQDLAELELIIVDDGSTDEDRDVISSYAEQDGRVEVLHQPNLGTAAALNRGIQAARARFIARMDADDIAWPTRLRVQRDEMDRRADLTVLGGSVRVIDDGGEVISTVHHPRGERIVEVLPHASPVVHPAVMLRRDAVLAVGGYRSEFAVAEDHDLWLRLHEAGARIDNLAEIVLDHRHHGGALSATLRRRQALEHVTNIAAHHLRRDGGADPVTDGAVIDERFVQEVARRAGIDPDAALLDARYWDLSLARGETLDRACAELFAASPSTSTREVIARHLLRGAGAYLREGRRRRAARCIIGALRASPTDAGRILWSSARSPRRRDA